MFNEHFFKQVTILYVEDDKTIRESLGEFLSRVFKKVIVASDGNEGLAKYIDDYNNQKEIALIISDISMPNKSGLHMIKEIREINKKIPFIILSAYGDSKYMHESIKLGVSHYVLKPVIIQDLMLHIKEVCENIYQELQIINKTHELKEYIEIVDKVALISSTDDKGVIKSVNDIFCEVSGYTKDELIGQPHNILRHSEMPSSAFKNLWDTIKSGHTWRGKVKNKAKDGSAYYVDANIFPLFCNDNKTIKGYMGVRFLTTDTELEKRNFKPKVVQNIIQQKSKLNSYEETIAQLNYKIEILERKISQSDDIEYILKTLYKEKEKNARLLSQIETYEKQLESSMAKGYALAKEAKNRETKAIEDLKQLTVKHESLHETIKIQKNEILQKENSIVSYQQRLSTALKQIEHLQDVIKFKEQQELENSMKK
ncbi:response regulator [Arcobacter sp. FWKO B]|uniref:response regulator n=1 Tax=Arcobacter sp. FWKO B TaxID=2593672 RepID=UPI0018A38188|nr:response regulator [Arcobacter sp. FWKO B]QOG12924.1 response regulator [Arcobacter sp. FWKO B]